MDHLIQKREDTLLTAVHHHHQHTSSYLYGVADTRQSSHVVCNGQHACGRVESTHTIACSVQRGEYRESHCILFSVALLFNVQYTVPIHLLYTMRCTSCVGDEWMHTISVTVTSRDGTVQWMVYACRERVISLFIPSRRRVYSYFMMDACMHP